MIDIRLVRDDPEGVKAALARRKGGEPDLIDRVRELDRARRETQARLDELRSEQKRASKEVPRLAGEEREALLARLKDLSTEVERLEEQERATGGELRDRMLAIPNLPHPSAPEGAEEADGELVRTWGEPPRLQGPRDHLEIGEDLGLIDTARAARTSGARFAYLLREAAILELALVRFAFDRLAAHRFVPAVPPVLVRREAMEGTGFLPTDEQQIFMLPQDDLYLVGTSEVSLAGLHMDEFVDPEALPIRYAGFSTCFRREAGSYGKDTRGIFRVHQFDKVEMFSLTLPDASWDEHEFLLARQEELLQALEIPYRVVNIAAGDLGASAAKKYDVEAWLPGQGAYREITSCSNCTDYQARRLGTRFKGEGGTAFVHTLNGTAVAVGRTLVALLENHQQPDGSVVIPEALRPYCGFERIGPK